MAITQTSCSNCGKPVSRGEPCPHCGEDLVGLDDVTVQPGDTCTFEVDGDALGLEAELVEVSVAIIDEWADLLSRNVFTAQLIGCVPLEGEADDLTEKAEEEWFLVEELKEELPQGFEEASGVEDLPVRFPIGQKNLGEGEVLLYRNNAGVSLAELVALANRRLTIRHVADIFAGILESVQSLHEHGFVHAYLNPELIRIRVRGTQLGVPLAAEEDEGRSEIGDLEDSGSIGDEDTSVETPEDEEESEAEEDDEGGDEWGSSQYDETKPHAPLRVRMAEVESEEISEIQEGHSLGEETSGVNEEGMSGENWIRRLGIASSEVETNSGGAAMSVGQGEKELLPVDREGHELEAVFDSTAGLFPHDEVPRDLEVIPGFSPPEMYTRGGPGIAPASDVFGVGSVLYYLVSGRIPPVSVYTRHSPAIPARSFRPDFPPGLGPVIKRATRPDPEMRYPDVESLRGGFRNALEAIEDRTPEKREEVPTMFLAVDRHTGIAKRERNPVNQDNTFKGSSENGEFSLVVVADGVSTASYGSGEIASRLLIEVAEEVWNDILPAYLMDEPVGEIETVEHILEEANERIVEYVNERHKPFSGSAHEVMGTTGLVALYHRGRVTLGAVGDSRGYLQRGPGLEQITIDHNLWTLSILEGLSADDALAMSRGDALARCLGTFQLDEGELHPVPPGLDIFQFPVASGDTLLLTTDGLIDFAGGNIISAEENILATLLAEPDPALACLELILLANRGGGGDNIGLGVARFE